MKITNLKESPQFLEKTLKLIETSFEYSPENSFDIDFYPLIEKKNHHNCHIMIENNDVVAHIGVLKKNLLLNSELYPFTMYGGIAVDSKYQGQGKFKELFDYVLTQYRHTTFSLLWSEKIELYEKFQFIPCVELNQYDYKENNIDSFPHLFEIQQTYLIDLSKEDLEKVKELYQSRKELRVYRSEEDWKSLSNITTAELYLVFQNDQIVNYFIKGKGQDLTDIIHEYGHLNKEQLEIMQEYGTVWSPQKLAESTSLFASLLRIEDKDLFKKFINNYTPIEILNIDNQIQFKFGEENYQESFEDFLLGIFGPGRFEEISAPQLFISGLDSI